MTISATLALFCLLGSGCENRPADPPATPAAAGGPKEKPTPPPIADKPAPVLYQTDFENMQTSAEPEGWILDGRFTVETFENQKVLTLPGNPLSTFSALIQPADFDQKKLERLLIDSSTSGQITARIHTLQKGKRLFSRFGVGLGGAEGFKLLMAANQGELQLWHARKKLSAIPFDWQSGQWVRLRLAVFPKSDGQWIVQGKVWHGKDEPEKWMIGVRIRQNPPVGRPALWATPYAGKPIHFDEVIVEMYPSATP